MRAEIVGMKDPMVNMIWPGSAEEKRFITVWYALYLVGFMVSREKNVE